MRFKEIIFLVLIFLGSYYTYYNFDFSTLPEKNMLKKYIDNSKNFENIKLKLLYKTKLLPSKNVVNIFSFRYNEKKKNKTRTVLIPKNIDRTIKKPQNNSQDHTKLKHLRKLNISYSLIGFMNKKNKKYAFLSSNDGVFIKAEGELIDSTNRILTIRSDEQQNSVTIENIRTGQQFIIKLINR